MGQEKSIGIVFATALSLSGWTMAGGSHEVPLSERLLKQAKAGDLKGITELRDRAMESPSTRYAYHLARYLADPSGYGEIFAREFPSAPGEVMGYPYELELATGSDGEQLTPYFLYAFDQLGRLAVAGNPTAIAKLYLVAVDASADEIRDMKAALAAQRDGGDASVVRELIDALERAY